MSALGLLMVAIITEVAATTALPRSNGLRDPAWAAFVIVGYAVSIWLLTLVVKHIPVSTTYAVWSGAGTALVAVIGFLWLDESVDALKVAALGMIIAGVVLLNLQGAH